MPPLSIAGVVVRHYGPVVVVSAAWGYSSSQRSYCAIKSFVVEVGEFGGKSWLVGVRVVGSSAWFRLVECASSFLIRRIRHDDRPRGG